MLQPNQLNNNPAISQWRRKRNSQWLHENLDVLSSFVGVINFDTEDHQQNLQNYVDQKIFDLFKSLTNDYYYKNFSITNDHKKSTKQLEKIIKMINIWNTGKFFPHPTQPEYNSKRYEKASEIFKNELKKELNNFYKITEYTNKEIIKAIIKKQTAISNAVVLGIKKEILQRIGEE